ncbi:FtsX-like permease family protein [Streptococcus ovuberis]|uniref:FtsX-like permease family protein n=1 Tax=Streptococcus ovuberis TaxID=1936207 RepID=A0A7X6MYK7_9STRE|nr:FtsX-like permease family protein [Streptococcus ovuberis]NKZ19858.1 FtsX-like permease family protein [Streptococcus ovuberis]
MAKRVYTKDLLQSFLKSKGRFFSIFSLMMIGSMALVALKVTTPNMQRTAQAYIEETKMVDLAVMADYGLSDQDVAELQSLEGAEVEFGYLVDATIAGRNEAVRIFSAPKKMSRYRVLAGEMPQQADQIALAQQLENRYQIGDKLTFTVADDSPLTSKTFTITGFVQSSEIWDRDSLGQTTVGTGDLAGYAVTTADAFDSPVYLIARLVYDDVAALPFYHPDYEKKIAEHQNELDHLLADNGQQRLTVLKADGQREIDKGYADIATSEKKLADGQNQLAKAQQEIASGQNQLSQGQAELVRGQEAIARVAGELEAGQVELDQSSQQLEAAKFELDLAKAELAQKAEQLADAEEKLQVGKQELEASKAQLDTARNQLDQAEATLAASKDQLDTLAGLIQTGRKEWQDGLSALEGQKQALIDQGIDPSSASDLQTLETQLAQTDQQLSSLESQYDQGFSDYQAGRQRYEQNLADYQAGQAQYKQGQEAYEASLSAYQAGKSQYEAGLAAYQQGLADYEAGQSQYEAGLSEYQSGLAGYQAGQAQLHQSSSAIAQNQAMIEEAVAKLGHSEADYARQKAEADKAIATAKKDLTAAQENLERLEEPSYKSYTRQTLPGGHGYDTFITGASAISAVGNVFPIVLYLVAALVTLTTMTRFVDEERHNAGIFKALGYSNQAIIAKFVLYGLVASLVGTAAGVFLGHTVLSSMIGNILTKKSVLGTIDRFFYPSWTLMALVLALISAVLPAYLVARRDLVKEQAAQLLQAKPPVAGASILLEKLPALWQRLSFTQKVTARNIFRYKQRMLMTILGVAGSVALLFAGLGIQSSISGVAQTQFEELVTYDLVVAENSRASESEKAEVAELLAAQSVEQAQAVRFLALTEDLGQAGEQTISVLVAEPSALAGLVNLRHRHSKTKLSLDERGAILTEKLAANYGVGIGDDVTITLEDRPISVRVAGITEMYAGHYLYLSKAYYRQVTGQEPIANSHLVALKERSAEAVRQAAADFLKRDGVTGVVQNTTLKAALTKTADSLAAVMLVLIALSVLLAVVILYNLTNINVAERIRELSTIKVLGFHNKEVTLYIYRETMVLSLVGILVGLAGGFFLHRLLLQMIAFSNIMFQPQVALYVYLVPIVAIAAILAVLGWLVNRRLRQVDMLEALKSVE